MLRIEGMEEEEGKPKIRREWCDICMVLNLPCPQRKNFFFNLFCVKGLFIRDIIYQILKFWLGFCFIFYTFNLFSILFAIKYFFLFCPHHISCYILSMWWWPIRISWFEIWMIVYSYWSWILMWYPTLPGKWWSFNIKI